MVRCSPLDQSLLDKTKLAKALVKLVKRGPEKTGGLAQSILDAAAKNAKGKVSDEKDGKVAESTKASTVKHAQPSRAAETTTGLKRPRESEMLSKKSPSAPATKVTNQTAASKVNSLTINKVSSPASKAGSLLKGDAKSATPPISNGVTAPKIKHVTTKPSSIFATLQSASKKPGTSNAAQRAVQSVEAKPR